MKIKLELMLMETFTTQQFVVPIYRAKLRKQLNRAIKSIEKNTCVEQLRKSTGALFVPTCHVQKYMVAKEA